MAGGGSAAAGGGDGADLQMHEIVGFWSQCPAVSPSGKKCAELWYLLQPYGGQLS